MYWKRSALALLIVTTAAACSKSGTQPSITSQATIRGRVAQTQPEPTPLPTARDAAGAASAAATAKTVTVAEVASDGSLTPVAHGSVNADGSFVVSGVPSNRSDLVVDAEASDGTGVGRATVYGETRVGDTLAVAPIDAETTVRALAWASLKASGSASAHTSPAEMALLVHASPSASASILSSNQIQAAAEGEAAAADAMTKVFANAGASLNASARAKVLAQPALDFENARVRGISSDSAHIALVNAALDAYENAGVSAEALVEASAAAASTFDAQVDGSTSARGELDAESVWMNLKARERLAAKYESGAEDSVALSIMNVLASTEARMRGASTAADIHAAMAANASAADSAVVGSMVHMLLSANATALLQGKVKAKAQAALDSASLSARLSGAANASAAAQAVANYHSAVKAAVQAMLQAAGRTDVDADAMTSLYIAARGGAYIRTT